MSNAKRHLRVISPELTVDERLRRAFPEVDIGRIAQRSTVLNTHNLSEKWEATVRQIQFWVDIAT